MMDLFKDLYILNVFENNLNYILSEISLQRNYRFGILFVYL